MIPCKSNHIKRRTDRCAVTLVLALILIIGNTAYTRAVMADDPKAREIMQKVDQRDDGDNGVSDLTMTLIDKQGQKRIRKIRQYSKDKGPDSYRIMFFLSPSDVRNTGFLTYDYDDQSKDDDQWLYLPALKKSKRIAASNKSGSFMGSDFNYSDMTSRDLEDFDFSLVKESKVNGDDVWLIQAVPRSKQIIEETGYKKSILFVRKDNYTVVRGVHWTDKEGKIKYRDSSGWRQIDGIWVSTQISMTTKRNKRTLHKTILDFSNIKFNQDLKEDFFTLRQLEKGL